MVLDELRIQSNDNLFNENHVKFLTDKYRALLLRREYFFKKLFKLIPIEYYTPICIGLELTNGFENDNCSNTYLKSTVAIPKYSEEATPIVSSLDFFDGEITFVTPERFKYVGHNKWLRNIIYATVGPDKYLYLRSANPQFQYLQNVKFSAIFDDIEEANNASNCAPASSEGNCDPMDAHVPVEDAFIPEIIQSIVRELSGALYRPKDIDNNDKDDLANRQS